MLWTFMTSYFSVKLCVTPPLVSIFPALFSLVITVPDHPLLINCNMFIHPVTFYVTFISIDYPEFGISYPPLTLIYHCLLLNPQYITIYIIIFKFILSQQTPVPSTFAVHALPVTTPATLVTL